MFFWYLPSSTCVIFTCSVYSFGPHRMQNYWSGAKLWKILMQFSLTPLRPAQAVNHGWQFLPSIWTNDVLKYTSFWAKNCSIFGLTAGNSEQCQEVYSVWFMLYGGRIFCLLFPFLARFKRSGLGQIWRHRDSNNSSLSITFARKV